LTSNWELALISIIQKEIEQLEWLIQSEKSGEEDVERADIHAQISRIGGLTDLAHAQEFPLSDTTRAKLLRQGEGVMELARSRTFDRTPGN
jgi:DNA polymerase III delta subunit